MKKTLINTIIIMVIFLCVSYAQNSSITVHGTGDPNTSARIKISAQGENKAYSFTDEFIVEAGATIVAWGPDALGDAIISGDGEVIFESEITCDIHLITGWNMIGVSVDPLDSVATNLFPNMIPPLYRFIGSYDPVEIVECGEGYWERNTESETVTIEGFSCSPLAISLMNGWNMISGPNCTVAIADVTDPAGIIIPGTLYGFNGAYVLSDYMEGGKGYWLRTNAAGDITISCAAEPSGILAKAIDKLPQLDDFGRIMITDATGAKQTLYLNVELEDESMIESYSLPPLPPDGLFDVRFSSGYCISTVDEEMIHLQASDYPVSISISNTIDDGAYTYTITEIVGSEEIAQHMLSEDETVEINNSKVTLLKLSKKAMQRLPTNFTISQNYPNPFNPSTKIKVALPKLEKVKIEVFNIIGKKIQTLLNKTMPAGYHEVEFNGQNLPSGVYLYRIKAGKWQDVKKMILIK
jgi:hypothetical protein